MPRSERSGEMTAYEAWAGMCPQGGAHAWAAPAPRYVVVCLKCAQPHPRTSEHQETSDA